MVKTTIKKPLHNYRALDRLYITENLTSQPGIRQPNWYDSQDINWDYFLFYCINIHIICLSAQQYYKF